MQTEYTKSPNFKSRSKTRSKSRSKSRSKTQKAAAKIQSFFKRTETPRKIAFLKAVCSDAGECVMFGREIGKIKRVFDDFKLDHTDSSQMRRIGEVSANGFVVELPFTRGGYTAYAVLKSSANARADNLFYEAFVGVFINKLNRFFPCFVETYGSYVYEDEHLYDKLKNGSSVNKDEFVAGLVKNKPFTYDTFLGASLLKKSCAKSKYFAVLTQHIKDATDMYQQSLNLRRDKDFITVHLVNYLFQIYCPLSGINKMFTHYDLHSSNVLIYTPSVCKNNSGTISYSSSDKYIRMIYHYKNGTTIEFNTFGIAKIIDYGRSFINEGKGSSEYLYDKLCNAYRYCGSLNGYSYLEKEYSPGASHYICSQKRNMSHDLRLVNDIWKTLGHSIDKYPVENNGPIRNIMSSVVYEEDYGTPEKIGAYKRVGDPINNVSDIYTALAHLIKKEPYFKEENERIFQGKTKIGEMHITADDLKPMRYIPA